MDIDHYEHQRGERPFWGLVVETGQTCEEWMEEGDSDYRESSTTHDMWIVRVRLPRAGEACDVAVCFEPKAGEGVLLLVAKHSTGDSFSSVSGLMSVVAGYKSEDKAMLARAELLEAGSDHPSVAIFDEDGQVQGVALEWHGHFESLDELSVSLFVVAPAS